MRRRGMMALAMGGAVLMGIPSHDAQAELELARKTTEWESSKDWTLSGTFGFYYPSCYGDAAPSDADGETSGCDAMALTYGEDGFRHLGLRLGYVLIEQLHVDFQFEFLRERADALGEETLLGSGALTTLSLMNGHLGLTGRLDFLHEQLLVPYGRVGVTGSIFKEKVEDGGDDQVVLGDRYGYYGALGLELLLDRFEPDRAADLDISQGINDTSLFIESRIQNLEIGQDSLPFSGVVVTGGLKFEF